MANRLEMAKVNSVLRLHAQGWSHRRIAAELGIHRETVARYVTGSSDDNVPPANEAKEPKPAKAPAGCPSPKPAKSAQRMSGPKPAKAPFGSRRPLESIMRLVTPARRDYKRNSYSNVPLGRFLSAHQWPVFKRPLTCMSASSKLGNGHAFTSAISLDRRGET